MKVRTTQDIFADVSILPREGEHLHACNMKGADGLDGFVWSSDVLLWPSETTTTG